MDQCCTEQYVRFVFFPSATTRFCIYLFKIRQLAVLKLVLWNVQKNGWVPVAPWMCYVLIRWYQSSFSLSYVLLIPAISGPSYFYGKTPLASVVRRSSSITKWAARISLERFDLESPNFTRTSIPTCSTATSDMTSTATSGWKLSLKNRRKCRFWWLQVEFLENTLRENHQIFITYRGQLAFQTGRIPRH